MNKKFFRTASGAFDSATTSSGKISSINKHSCDDMATTVEFSDSFETAPTSSPASSYHHRIGISTNDAASAISKWTNDTASAETDDIWDPTTVEVTAKSFFNSQRDDTHQNQTSKAHDSSIDLVVASPCNDNNNNMKSNSSTPSTTKRRSILKKMSLLTCAFSSSSGESVENEEDGHEEDDKRSPSSTRNQMALVPVPSSASDEDFKASFHDFSKTISTPLGISSKGLEDAFSSNSVWSPSSPMFSTNLFHQGEQTRPESNGAIVPMPQSPIVSKQSTEASRRALLSSGKRRSNHDVNRDDNVFTSPERSLVVPTEDLSIHNSMSENNLANRMGLVMPHSCFLPFEDTSEEEKKIDYEPSYPTNRYNVFAYCKPSPKTPENLSPSIIKGASRRRMQSHEIDHYRPHQDINNHRNVDDDSVSVYSDALSVDSKEIDEIRRSLMAEPYQEIDLFRPRNDGSHSVEPEQHGHRTNKEPNAGYNKSTGRPKTVHQRPVLPYINSSTNVDDNNTNGFQRSVVPRGLDSIDKDDISLTAFGGEDDELVWISSSAQKHQHQVSPTPTSPSTYIEIKPNRPVSPIIDQKMFVKRRCICGRQRECNGISAGFHILKDPRCGYTRVPNQRLLVSNLFSSLPTKSKLFLNLENNRFRDSILRHIERLEGEQLYNDVDNDDYDSADNDDGMFIANHHFHPEIIFSHINGDGTYGLPLYISKEDMKKLSISLPVSDMDRARDVHGRLTDKYYVIPSHTLDQSMKDLKTGVRAGRVSIKKDEKHLEFSGSQLSFRNLESDDTSPDITSMDAYEMKPEFWYPVQKGSVRFVNSPPSNRGEPQKEQQHASTRGTSRCYSRTDLTSQLISIDEAPWDEEDAHSTTTNQKQQIDSATKAKTSKTYSDNYETNIFESMVRSTWNL